MTDMLHTQRRLERIHHIGKAFAASPSGLALIGLGSTGPQAERLDAYSDLDFFAVVEAGAKHAYLQQLDWLDRIAPVSWHFHNTPDGCKLLFQDDIYCEFAVFEPHELAGIPFSTGKVLWKRDDVDAAIATPQLPEPRPLNHSIEWCLYEALSNLYVGIGRYCRGEKLSAFRFVQSYAVDRVIELIERTWDADVRARDPFSNERRFEQRYPEFAPLLSAFMPGYRDSPKAALAMLEFLDLHWEVPAPLAASIDRMARSQLR
ncbi:MAG TPA: hypothetical protein VFV64_05240 [Permianibacter sp.]|nr:hypothetical protein [Permianibacter sp.]